MADARDQTSFHVRRAVEGEESSLEWIVARLDPFLEAQVRHRLHGSRDQQAVRDIVMETWLVALRRLGDLRSQGGRIAPVLVRFLGTTALNLCNRHLERRIRMEASMPETVDGPVEPDRMADRTRGVVTSANARDIRAIVARCIDALDAKKREVVVMRLLEGHSNQELAELLGVPPNTVAVRYKRALAELRRCLPEDLMEEVTGGEGP